MRTVPASEAKRAFASVLDAAMHEPVLIQRQKHDVAVVLSMTEYERLTKLNIAEFQRFCDQIGGRATREGLDEEALTTLLDEPDGD